LTPAEVHASTSSKFIALVVLPVIWMLTYRAAQPPDVGCGDGVGVAAHRPAKE
jgi:hypothetical protein